MSRGPGKWQRSIIAALIEMPAVWLRDLLPRSHSDAQHQALYRAARRLRDDGAIAIWPGGESNNRQLLLARPGFKVRPPKVPRRPLLDSLSRMRRVSAATARDALMASLVRPPCRKFPFLFPSGAPPRAPCIRQTR